MSQGSVDKNSVQSIKKRFEQQILNSSKSNTSCPSAKIKTDFNRSVSAESQSQLNFKKCQDIAKEILTNKNHNRSVSADSLKRKQEDATVSLTTTSITTIDETSADDNINFAFNRPQIDPRRKSQIKRKPAFRCGDNKHTTTTTVDNTLNQQSFLFKHTELRNTSVVNSDRVVNDKYNTNKIDKNNPNKIDKNDNPNPPSVLFALMKKNASAPSPPIVNNECDVNKDSLDKTPDVNHMLKRLEQLLLKDNQNVKITRPPLQQVSTTPSVKTDVVTRENNKIRAIKDKLQEIHEAKDNNKAYQPDILNNLKNTVEYAVSSKKSALHQQRHYPEPLYAEPFQFSKISGVKNCAGDTNKSIKCVVDSFESKRRRSIENEKFLEITSDDSGDCIDKRNSAYAVSNVKPDLHYMCTSIYDVPTESGPPEVVDFNVIRRECAELNRTLDKSRRRL